MYVEIKRICEVNAPLDLCIENANDWTHFIFLHKKSHAQFRLIYRENQKELFLYQAYLIYPLPFYKTYLVLRKYQPEQNGYVQIYLDVKSGHVNFLNSKVIKQEDRCQIVGEFVIWLSWPFRVFPQVFFWLFKNRMQKVMKEDNELLKEQVKEKMSFNQFNLDAACLAAKVDFYSLSQDLLKKSFPQAECYFEDHVFEDLNK